MKKGTDYWGEIRDKFQTGFQRKGRICKGKFKGKDKVKGTQEEINKCGGKGAESWKLLIDLESQIQKFLKLSSLRSVIHLVSNIMCSAKFVELL